MATGLVLQVPHSWMRGLVMLVASIVVGQALVSGR
jgi:hypothetical protein